MRVHDLYQLLANSVLALHVAIVAFVVGGLVLIIAGNARRWRWVNAPAFRLAHLSAIAVVVAEAWSGITCPLTTFEAWLRTQAGAGAYRGGFIEHWLQRVLYYDAPPWVFVLSYTLFGLLVMITWWAFPPVFRRRPPTRRRVRPATVAGEPRRGAQGRVQ
jgi:polyferredoxin